MKFAVALGGLLLIGALGAGGYLFLNNGELPGLFGGSATREPPPRITGETTTDNASQQQAQVSESEQPVSAGATETGEADTGVDTLDTSDASDLLAETDDAVDGLLDPVDDGPVRFVVPMDCTVGRNCVVQNYVDSLPGLEDADYTCGVLSYDQHTGTDIRLPSHREMEAGVDVLAAAAGTVLSIRDGMPDVNFRLVGRDALTGRDLGNVVTIQHGDGLETTYGHMKRGSITVGEGDSVTAGQPIGQVGLSGLTEVPHLHFEVRLNDTVIDPFTGYVAELGCGSQGEPLWTEAALDAFKYIPSLVLRLGFSDRVLNRNAIEYGLEQTDTPIDRNVPSLLLHVYVAGLRTGDIARFQLIDPNDETFIDSERIIDRNASVQLLRAGAADRTTPWDAGTYQGVFTLSRANEGVSEVILRAETTVELE